MDGYKILFDELVVIFNGMVVNGLFIYFRIFIGYILSVEVLSVVIDRIRRMKVDNFFFIYFFDCEFFI